MSIATGKIQLLGRVPVEDWRDHRGNKVSAGLIQGGVYVQNPITRAEYVIVAQAVETGPGDVEVTRYHRHRLVGQKITYLDTCLALNNVHAQTFYARISRLGNLWLWVPWGTANHAGTVSGSYPVRFRFTKGITVRARNSKWVQVLAHLGKGAQPVAGPSGLLGIRRPSGSKELWELHDEAVALKRNRPRKTATRLKVGPGPYQGGLVTEDYFYALSGKTNEQQVIYQHRWGKSTVPVGKLNVSAVGEKGTRADEAQSLLLIRGVLHLFKRYNLMKDRYADLHGIRW